MSETIPDDIREAAEKMLDGIHCNVTIDMQDDYGGPALDIDNGEIMRLLSEALLAERQRTIEECAKVAEGFWNNGGPSYRLTAAIAAAIRSLK